MAEEEQLVYEDWTAEACPKEVHDRAGLSRDISRVIVRVKEEVLSIEE